MHARAAALLVVLGALATAAMPDRRHPPFDDSLAQTAPTTTPAEYLPALATHQDPNPEPGADSKRAKRRRRIGTVAVPHRRRTLPPQVSLRVDALEFDGPNLATFVDDREAAAGKSY